MRVMGACKRQAFEIVVGHRAAETLLRETHIQRRIGGHDRRHHGSRIGGERRRALLDMMAECGKQRRDVADAAAISGSIASP